MDFSGFVFPAPALNNGTRPPVVSDGWHQRSSGDFHYGVDIGYRRIKSSESNQLPYGTDGFYNPPGTPALAAGPGIVVISEDITTGGHVQIDHGNGIQTQYMHLNPRAVSKGQNVSAGQIVGTIGNDIRPGKYKWNHLHFQLRINGDRVDPQPYVESWPAIQAPSGLFGLDNTALIAIAAAAGLTYWYLS